MSNTLWPAQVQRLYWDVRFLMSWMTKMEGHWKKKKEKKTKKYSRIL
jgi:hypothetical protein